MLKLPGWFAELTINGQPCGWLTANLTWGTGYQCPGEVDPPQNPPPGGSCAASPWFQSESNAGDNIERDAILFF